MPKQRQPRNCLHCTEPFTSWHKEQRYCSRPCGYEGRKVKPADRFWAKVDTSAGPDKCWLWTAWIHPDGYGEFKARTGITVRAHRFAYELLIGPIPAGLELDHVKGRGCANRHCVNPKHLEIVSGRVNTLRGTSFAAINAQKTRCPQGHPYDATNTYINTNGRRVCRICRCAWKRVTRARRATLHRDLLGGDK